MQITTLKPHLHVGERTLVEFKPSAPLPYGAYVHWINHHIGLLISLNVAQDPPTETYSPSSFAKFIAGRLPLEASFDLIMLYGFTTDPAECLWIVCSSNSHDCVEGNYGEYVLPFPHEALMAIAILEPEVGHRTLTLEEVSRISYGHVKRDEHEPVCIAITPLGVPRFSYHQAVL